MFEAGDTRVYAYRPMEERVFKALVYKSRSLLAKLLLFVASKVKKLLPAPKPHEILPGVTKPTVILRDMLIAQIQAADFKTKYHRKLLNDGRLRSTYYKEVLQLPQHTLTVLHSSARLDGEHPLKQLEVQSLLPAFIAAKGRFEKQKEIDEEAERQQKALKQIEKILGIGKSTDSSNTEPLKIRSPEDECTYVYIP